MRAVKVLSAILALAVAVPLAAQERHAQSDRGWMGIGFAWEDDAPDEARVTEVVRESAAAEAGVRRGDVILRIDGEPASAATVERLRGRLRVGDTVRLRIRRDGAEMEQSVVAGRAPGERIIIRERAPGEDEVITITVPGEAIRMRIDTVRAHMDRLLTRMDSLHGRIELLRGDSTVVFRLDRDHLRNLPGRVHVLGDSTVIRLDSVLRLDSLVTIRTEPLRRQLEQLHVDAYPFRDLDPETPFFMELGRRSVAGAELAEMNAGLSRYFRTDRGLLVVQVSENTPMARAGVEPGDVILRAGDAEVDEVGDLRRALADAGSEGRLHVDLVRQGNRRSVDLQWEPTHWRVVAPSARARQRADERERVEVRRQRVRERQARERAPSN